MSSTENFPVIPVIPRETLTNAPMYITYQRIGAGHYDATIETHQEPIALPSSAVTMPTTPGLVEDHLPSENVHNQLAAVGFRCGRENGKNKQERTFCRVYKDGCKCFQTIKGCTSITSTCGCFNCENPYGERPVTQTVISEPVPRKRRRHFPKEVLTGSEQEFLESRGIGVIPPPWSTFEKLLFKECAFHLTAMDALDLDLLEGMYNRAIKDYSNNLASIPCTNSAQLDIIPRERSSKEIQKTFSWMQKEDKVFTVMFKNQIKLDFEG